MWNRAKYRIVSLICLVMAVLASRDTFPEYNFIRYGFILAEVLAVFIGGHGSIIKGIAILEIVISFAVVFEKSNKAENLIESKKIARLEATKIITENCNEYANQWAKRDCAIRNESKIEHNRVVNEKIANLKVSVSGIKIIQADPSLFAFIIFSCALPWLSFISAKKIEIEKEIVIEEKIIEKMIEPEYSQFVKDLHSNASDLSLSEQYNVDRRTIKKLRVQFCSKQFIKRPTHVQLSDKVVNINEVKRA